MFHIHRHHHHLKQTTQLSFIRFIIALGISGVTVIWPLYIKSFGLTNSDIGFVSAGIVLLSFVFSLLSTTILEKYNELKLLILSLGIFFLSYLAIYFFPSLSVFIVFSAVLAMATILRNETFNILFRDESKKKEFQENEGLMFSLWNLGWIVGPLIAGYFISSYPFNSVFISSSALIFIALIVLLRSQIKVPKKKREKLDRNIVENLKLFFSKPNLVKAYMIATAQTVWWALVYIYVPLFMIQEQISESSITLFLSLVIVPFVLLEYKISKKFKIYSYRKFFFLGFGLLTLVSFILFFNTDVNLLFPLLIVGSVALAFVEPIHDAFFFESVSKLDEEKYYPIFATSDEIGSFIGKISIAGILLILPTSYVYLFLGLTMGSVALMSLTIKN